MLLQKQNEILFKAFFPDVWHVFLLTIFCISGWNACAAPTLIREDKCLSVSLVKEMRLGNAHTNKGITIE